jgi:hypothetical protein
MAHDKNTKLNGVIQASNILNAAFFSSCRSQIIKEKMARAIQKFVIRLISKTLCKGKY